MELPVHLLHLPVLDDVFLQCLSHKAGCLWRGYSIQSVWCLRSGRIKKMVPILLVPYCPALVKGGLDAPKGGNQAVKGSSDYFCCQLLVVEEHMQASKVKTLRGNQKDWFPWILFSAHRFLTENTCSLNYAEENLLCWTLMFLHWPYLCCLCFCNTVAQYLQKKSSMFPRSLTSPF